MTTYKLASALTKHQYWKSKLNSNHSTNLLLQKIVLYLHLVLNLLGSPVGESIMIVKVGETEVFVTYNK